MAREIFFNDRLAFDAPVGARGARLRVTEALPPEPPFAAARPANARARFGLCSIPLFDIVNVQNWPAAPSRPVATPLAPGEGRRGRLFILLR
jgi:hypothetical protein